MGATPRRIVLAGAAGIAAIALSGCGALTAGSSHGGGAGTANSVTGSAAPQIAAAAGENAGSTSATSTASRATQARPAGGHSTTTHSAHAAGTSQPTRRSPDGPELLPSPAPGVPTGPGTVNPTSLNPCTVVTATDAARLLGSAASRFTPEQEPDDKDEFTACGYRSSDHKTLLVNIAIDQNAVYDFDSYWGPGAAGGPMGAVSTPIPRLGDKAYQLVFTKQQSGPATRNLGVVSHGVVLELHASGPSNALPSKAALVSTARTAVSRLT